MGETVQTLTAIFRHCQGHERQLSRRRRVVRGRRVPPMTVGSKDAPRLFPHRILDSHLRRPHNVRSRKPPHQHRRHPYFLRHRLNPVSSPPSHPPFSLTPSHQRHTSQPLHTPRCPIRTRPLRLRLCISRCKCKCNHRCSASCTCTRRPMVVTSCGPANGSRHTHQCRRRMLSFHRTLFRFQRQLWALHRSSATTGRAMQTWGGISPARLA